jgi:hypothetical protein
MADLDNDGVNDLLVGFRAGGLVLWRGGDFSTGLAELAWMSDGQDDFTGWIPAPNSPCAGLRTQDQHPPIFSAFAGSISPAGSYERMPQGKT